jgi:hypothetical protein
MLPSKALPIPERLGISFFNSHGARLKMFEKFCSRPRREKAKTSNSNPNSYRLLLR